MNKPVVLISTAAVVVVGAGLLAWYLRPAGSPAGTPPFATPSTLPACSQAVSELLQGGSCSDKLRIYEKAIGTCKDQYVMVEDPEPYETIFADEIFEIARCFEADGESARAKQALEQALKNPDWQMNGPAGCSGHLMARAELEALGRPAQATCMKNAELEEVVKKTLVHFAPDSLERLLGQGTVLSAGTYESDDVCPVTYAEVRESLRRALLKAPKNLQILKKEQAEEGSRFLIGGTLVDPWLVLDFVPADGCEHLSQVLLNQSPE